MFTLYILIGINVNSELKGNKRCKRTRCVHGVGVYTTAVGLMCNRYCACDLCVNVFVNKSCGSPAGLELLLVDPSSSLGTACPLGVLSIYYV